MKSRKRKSVLREEEEWQPIGPFRFHQLPQALAVDILSRLTVKTLFNCRCVCKSWLSIISNHQFSRLHSSRSPTGILFMTLQPIRSSRIVYFTQIEECAGSDFRVQKMSFTPGNNIPIPVSEIALINSCNGLVYFRGYGLLYVCNPILGEFITIPVANKGKPLEGWFEGLGFSGTTNEYKVLQTFIPLNKSSSGDKCNNYEAEIYTIGTGVRRSIGNVPTNPGELQFDAFLHGALHWVVSFSCKTSAFIHSFNFETEQFQPLPLPSYFGSIEKKKEDCLTLKLAVFGGCLLLCVFEKYSSKLDVWVMKDYGVHESWTKTLVIEDQNLGYTQYKPIKFLSNGEILMSRNHRDVLCYNQGVMSSRKTGITRTGSRAHSIAYSPCFISLYNVAKVEEVIRIRDSKKSKRLFAEGSSDCAGSGIPPHKSTKLNSGYGCPTSKEGLPRAINSSLDFTWRTGTACALCGGDLGYVFRGKGFAVCQQCFDAGYS